MSRNKDYLPGGDQAFLEWVIEFLKYLMSRLTKFNFPKAEYDLLEQEKDIYAQKLEVSRESATRTPVNIKEKNAAKKVLKTHVRVSTGEYLMRNHLLTVGDREMLGLPIHKTTRTPAPVADAAPDFDIDSHTIYRLIIHFFERGSDHSKAKPAGQHGAEIAWEISDTPLIKVSELTHSSFDTRTPFTLEFEGDQRGQTVYLALRWENTRGLKGPWSEIRKAIIP
jgi:hypothetical protein